MIFGSREFCEMLRKCRAAGLTFSQIQVMSLLYLKPSSRIELTSLTGMTFEGVRKVLKILINIGDVSTGNPPPRPGKYRTIYYLTIQGREMLDRVRFEKTED